MNTIKRISLLTGFALSFSFAVMAQNLKDADQAFEAGKYYTAIEYYKKVLPKVKKKEEKARIHFQVAQSYRFLGDWKNAESWYTRVTKTGYPDDRATLYLAQAKLFNEKYDEALIEFQKYKAAVPDDVAAANGIKACENAQQWKEQPSRWRVENVPQINSKEFDFSPAYSDRRHNALIITSKREGQSSSKTDPNTGRMYSDMFETRVDKNGKWSVPTPVATVNGPYNDGSAQLNKKTDKMYFTRCNEAKKTVTHCKIYMAERKGNGWGEPVLIDFGLESATLDSFNFRHPAVSADEMTMVFSSDMTDGNQGRQNNTSDLWMSKYDKKTRKWSKPVNLGSEINTERREGFPFIRENGTLYFSSDGHAGMGGLDVFSATWDANANKWTKVENMKSPVNSPADDFGIIFDGLKDRGFLTSNRPGGKGQDDIWSFYYQQCTIQVETYIYDCNFNIPVKNATARCVGSDGTAVEVKTDAYGKAKIRLLPEVDYIITAITDSAQSAKGTRYLAAADKIKISTRGAENDLNEKFEKTYNASICCMLPDESIKLPAVLYELDRYVLLPESKDSLNMLYNTLISNPGIVIELGSHTDCRGSDQKNLVLSENRAKACVDYLVKEKGINPDRLRAKGFGETRPLKLADGTQLTEKYINSIKDKKEQERLHQLNRRTTFRVISWDFVDPKAPKTDRSINRPVIRDSFWGDGDLTDDKTTD